MMKRKWDVSSKEVRQKAIAEVITRIEEQTDVEVGIITAEDIIDIVLQNVGPDIYNLAIKDVKKLLQSRLSDIETEVDLLETS